MTAVLERQRTRRAVAPALPHAARVRPGRVGDAEALFQLAVAGGSGLTNLPADRDALVDKLVASEAALASVDARAAGAPILLVVELGTRIVGTSCIFAHVGAEWPFYSYRITRQTKRSRALGCAATVSMLNVVNDFDGETEVGGLFVDPDTRGLAIGALAARARYLFIARHRDWFGNRVIAELRGWQDADRRSPVWDAVGRHFYGLEFEEADRTGALHGNQFIADLHPQAPIYVSLLPKAAQTALGQPHDDGRRAFDMLLAEGFRSEGYVDIFDGGPTLVADIDAVATVRGARSKEVIGVAPLEGTLEVIASFGATTDFAMARGLIDEQADGVVIDAAFAAVLGIRPGDQLLYAAG